MPAVLKESWLTVPVVSMILAAVVGYFSSQLQRERELTEQNGEIDAIALRLTIIERWVEKTELNRFTNRDAMQMQALLNERLEHHSEIPAHGTVGARLNAIESRLAIIESTSPYSRSRGPYQDRRIEE